MNRFAKSLALASAILGGLVLTALILMTSLSITGRALSAFGLGPVPGDFELVEAGIAFCVFAFLPICQVQSGHATVDLFTSAAGLRANRLLVAIWEALFAAVLIVIVWRLGAGMAAKFANGETSLFLQFPIWWPYAACMLPAGASVLVALWSAADRWRAVLTGIETRSILPGGHQ